MYACFGAQLFYLDACDQVCGDALASFEISPHGQLLAVGSTEGTQ